ncbi:hypothetical protein C8R43DRAFT_206421 [Mycena crocata]|nr:hypothetical protein C8R43DRAFT_206421 [Mycena crocata]
MTGTSQQSDASSSSALDSTCAPRAEAHQKMVSVTTSISGGPTRIDLENNQISILSPGGSLCENVHNANGSATDSLNHLFPPSPPCPRKILPSPPLPPLHTTLANSEATGFSSGYLSRTTNIGLTSGGGTIVITVEKPKITTSSILIPSYSAPSRAPPCRYSRSPALNAHANAFVPGGTLRLAKTVDGADDAQIDAEQWSSQKQPAFSPSSVIDTSSLSDADHTSAGLGGSEPQNQTPSQMAPSGSSGFTSPLPITSTMLNIVARPFVPGGFQRPAYKIAVKDAQGREVDLEEIQPHIRPTASPVRQSSTSVSPVGSGLNVNAGAFVPAAISGSAADLVPQSVDAEVELEQAQNQAGLSASPGFTSLPPTPPTMLNIVTDAFVPGGFHRAASKIALKDANGRAIDLDDIKQPQSPAVGKIEKGILGLVWPNMA